MRQLTKFIVVLLLGLGLLTWLASWALTQTTRSWFESDVEQRAQLAVNSGQSGLLRRWEQGDLKGVRTILSGISRDKRIMGAAVCARGGKLVAASEAYPVTFRCEEIEQQEAGEVWSFPRDLPGGLVYVSAIHLEGGPEDAFAVVLQDLSYISRRESDARALVLYGFLILSVAASVLTILAARLSWRGWTEELRRSLNGEHRRADFQPLLRDVREMALRLVAESESGQEASGWTPERLKKVLTKNLGGEKVIVVANREPYIHEHTDDGIKVLHPASGLVTALEPVMRVCSGIWVAHGGGSADKETVDANNQVKVPPGEESYLLRRVWLSEAEEQGYYYGFANEGLWALCHLADNRPLFRAEDLAYYRAVNEKFAEAVCQVADTDDPVVLVQDYHFALAPRMIRARLPKATILTFWHIPWPNAERFGICPWREELLDGLLGSSILGFHTQQHCNYFLDAVDSFLEARIDRERNAVVQGPRSTLIRPYPISVEWPVHWVKESPPPAKCRAEVFEELSLSPEMLLGIGIDRLDYTKGIEERLLAVERLLMRYPEFIGRFVFAQLAAPSRTKIPRYRELNDIVEATAARINQRFGYAGYRPIALLRAHHEPPTVYRYYRAANLCYVSSLHDGMNLVAKEFVAARDDERGVLVLSQFTGAARELTEALVVNPYDLEEASAALALALKMPQKEQMERMRAMRALVSEFNIYRWAGRMLIDAATLRRKERLTGKLSAQ